MRAHLDPKERPMCVSVVLKALLDRSVPTLLKLKRQNHVLFVKGFYKVYAVVPI